MTDENRKLVVAITEDVDQLKKIKKFPLEKQRDILDASLDFLEVSNPDDYHLKNSPSLEAKFAILRARASNKLISPALDIPLPEKARPHLGHESARLGLSVGESQKSKLLKEFHIRFALQDPLDSEIGYMRNAGVGFFDLSLRMLEETTELQVQSFYIIDVEAYPHYDLFQRAPSWKFKLGLERRDLENCFNCSYTGAQVYRGRTWPLTRGRSLLFYALLGGEAMYADKHPESDYLVGVGGNVGFIQHLSPGTKLMWDGVYSKYIGSKRGEFYRLDFEGRTQVDTNLAFGFIHSKQAGSEVVQLKTYYYF